MHLRKWLAWSLALVATAAAAQLTPVDPDWKELDAPPPPAFDVARLVPFDVNIGSQLKFGVDPATIQIGSDGIVRYVIVAQSSSGVINAMYEALRCGTGEVRTLARYNASGGWSAADRAEWRSLWASQPSKHSLMFAKQGGCVGNSPPRSVAQIVRDLKNQDFEKLR
ncbi:MAG: CNP1-like family protein [Ramlibacter sp.]|nr:CNP1-like family protein [Ramlibacter sp.]